MLVNLNIFCLKDGRRFLFGIFLSLFSLTPRTKMALDEKERCEQYVKKTFRWRQTDLFWKSCGNRVRSLKFTICCDSFSKRVVTSTNICLKLLYVKVQISPPEIGYSAIFGRRSLIRAPNNAEDTIKLLLTCFLCKQRFDRQFTMISYHNKKLY